MKDIRGKEQTAYIVKNKKTGEQFITYESYAKELSKDGYKIVTKEGEADFKQNKIRTNK